MPCRATAAVAWDFQKHEAVGERHKQGVCVPAAVAGISKSMRRVDCFLHCGGVIRAAVAGISKSMRRFSALARSTNSNSRSCRDFQKHEAEAWGSLGRMVPSGRSCRDFQKHEADVHQEKHPDCLGRSCRDFQKHEAAKEDEQFTFKHGPQLPGFPKA